MNAREERTDPGPQNMRSSETFSGIRIVDFTNNLAGPLATMILADLGADVIKIERPDTGDDTRVLPERWGSESAIFVSCNRNKRSVVLDLKTPTGQMGAEKLIGSADVLVESFRPGKMDALGFSETRLRSIDPRLIYCSVSAFGRTESGRELPGYDPILQAFCGIMAATGHDGTPPARAGASVVDNSTGMWTAMAIMAALTRRRISGVGEYIETTLIDAGVAMMAKETAILQATGQDPRRLGSASSFSAPYEAFKTADGWIMVAAANTNLFRRLCHAVSLPALASDERFTTPMRRTDQRAELHDLLGKIFLTETSESWVTRLHDAGVPAGPINDLSTCLDSPIARERRLLAPTVGAPEPGRMLLRTPLQTGENVTYRWPPRLGEHTTEVFAELGISTQTGPSVDTDSLDPTDQGDSLGAPLSVEEIVRSLEERRYDCMVRCDVDVLGELLSDKLTYRHLNGVVDGRELYLSNLRSRTYEYTDITHHTDRVEVLGNVALSHGSLFAHARLRGRAVELRCATLSVWSMEDKWRLVAYQPTATDGQQSDRKQR
jgi:crotonobetainyl-CoA:carnitine CoA-transferase CaiB-like acyl-CoA transferase